MYRKEIKQRALELMEGNSAGAIVNILLREFPPSEVPSERTINRWRKEAPKEPDSQQPPPFDRIIARRREQHFDNLAEIAKALLVRGIDTVEPCRSGYTLFDGDFNWELTRDELASLLYDNVEQTRSDYKDYDFELLIYHLIHYYPEIPEVGLEGVIREKPYKLIETLQSLSRIRIFEGKCPICEKLVAD